MKVKHLVSKGKREFINRTYKKPDGSEILYTEALLDIGLTGIGAAWDEVLRLHPKDYFRGPTPDYNKRKYPESYVWEFKKMINGSRVYIKLKIDNKRGCVCLSFHKDW
jgi:hypothetical protein